MPVYKDTERAEAYRLFVEEGVQDWHELARRSGLSLTTLKRHLRGDALRDYRERCAEARRLYVEAGVVDVNTICSAARIHHNLWKRIYHASWDSERASYVAAHPTLFTTAQLLMQAAEGLLSQVRATGYSGENVQQLVALSNSFEKLRTGEHRIEMALVGVMEFGEFVRANAQRMGWTEENVRVLQIALDAFGHVQLEKLRELGK